MHQRLLVGAAGLHHYHTHTHTQAASAFFCTIMTPSPPKRIRGFILNLNIKRLRKEGEKEEGRVETGKGSEVNAAIFGNKREFLMQVCTERLLLGSLNNLQGLQSTLIGTCTVCVTAFTVTVQGFFPPKVECTRKCSGGN